jgi:hypothetical protein
MILDNNKIKQDLLILEKKNKSITNICIYCLIIGLFLLLLSFSIIKSIEILDTLAGLLCKISICSFSLILTEGLIGSLIEYKKRDFYIEKNFWKVIESNLTKKYIEHKKYIFEFTSGYNIYVDENTYNNGKIGERYFLVIKNKPCSNLIKHKKKLYIIYKKNDFLKYENNYCEISNNEKKHLEDKKIKNTLFLYNLPNYLEIIFISITTSTGICTILQILKQQYLTYLHDSVLIILIFVLFVVVFVCLNSFRRKKIKHVFLNQCILVEEKNNYSLVAQYEDKYAIIKIFAKEDFLDYTHNIKKKRNF